MKRRRATGRAASDVLRESPTELPVESGSLPAAAVRVIDGHLVRPVRAGDERETLRPGRVVSGFGTERVDDVDAERARRDADQLARARLRSEGERGRMTDRTGEDLDRSAGGPWSAGRR